MTPVSVQQPSSTRLHAPRRTPARELERRPWACTTRSFRALDHSFRVRVFDTDVGRFIEEVYGALPTGDAGAPAYSVIDRGPRKSGMRRYAIYWGEERVELTNTLERGLALLMWHVNQQAVLSAVTSRVVLHAAAAERDGVAVLLPGAMEAGKTTTVAGLLRAGFSYVTDEATALDPITLEVMAFHKPLSVDIGSWEVLEDLKPADADLGLAQWQVPPRSVGPLAADVVPRLIVAPQYTAGAVTELKSISKAEMLVHLAGCTFDFAVQPRRNLDVLGRLVTGAGCHRLTIGDLDSAVRLIEQLVADHR